MAAILLRVISAILSFVFLITGYGSMIGGTPVVDVEVLDLSLDGFLGNVDENYRVFYTYSEWESFCKGIEDTRMKAFASKFEKADFKGRSLAVIDIEKSSSEWRVKVVGANQNTTTLKINYMKVNEEDVGGFQVVCYATIFAFTNNKYVSKVELNEMEKMTVPFLIDACSPNYFHVFKAESESGSAELFGEEKHLFKDYKSWNDFLESGKWEFKGCEHIFDEEYFERKNLAVTIISHGAGDSLRISLPIEKENTVKFTCYSVSEPIVSPDILSFEAVFVETGKAVDSISTEKGERKTIPFMLDGSVPIGTFY